MVNQQHCRSAQELLTITEVAPLAGAAAVKRLSSHAIDPLQQHCLEVVITLVA